LGGLYAISTSHSFEVATVATCATTVPIPGLAGVIERKGLSTWKPKSIV